MSGLKRKPTILQYIGVDMKNFDWEIYLLNYPELIAKGVRTKNDAHNHFKSIGHWEKRSCQVPASFNADRYMKSHSYLNFQSPRDAYIHSMRVGSVLKRNEGFRRTSQAYRNPTASQPRRPPSISKMAIRPSKPPTKIHPLPNPSLPRPRRVAPAVIAKNHTARQQQRSNNLIPSLMSMNAKRNVRQPKAGELVLREAPSSYFARLGVLGPPKYMN